MTRFTQLALLTLLLALVSATAGCVKLRQVVTLMPDGSGKIELRYALSQAMIDLARQNGDEPFAQVRPGAMSEGAEGVVAFTEPTIEEMGGYTYLTYTAYFRDINQLTINGLGEGTPAQYRYTRQGDSATLTLSHGVILSMVADYEPADDANANDVRQAMAGMIMQEHFVLPGNVLSDPGVRTQGNTAQIDLSIDNLIDGDGPIETLHGMDSVTFEIEEVITSDADVAAFNAELEAAVAAWQARTR